jgi:hypothetical protein
VYRIADINANMNVAGGGINMAQRVMDCGDAGHILVSSAVADVLGHLAGWPKYLTDLGEHRVKHGVKMHLYAVCVDDVANREIPEKLRPKGGAATNRSKRLAVVAAAVLVIAAGAGALAWQSGWFTPAPAVTARPERTMSYWVTVQKYRDEQPFQDPFRLAGDINFEANYRIQLGFSSPQEGYLYLINEGPESTDAAPDYHVLFPSPVMNGGSPRLAANAQILIPPDGKKFIRFDEQQGTEKLWMVWAKEEPPVLASAVEAATFTAAGGGAVADAARATALRRYLADTSRTMPEVRQDDAGKQSVVTAKGDVLVYLRRLEHH